MLQFLLIIYIYVLLHQPKTLKQIFPVRHESPLGANPVEIQSYHPPWKALTDFALHHNELDRLDPNAPHFQHLINQVSLGHILKDLISSLT